MIDYVISSGCSLAWGDELKDRDQSRYSALIAKHLNAKLFDSSGCGYSNEAISFNLINDTIGLLKGNKIVPERTLVLLNLTMITRLSYFNTEARGWFSTFPQRVSTAKAVRRAIAGQQAVFDKYMHQAELKHFYENHNDMRFLMYHISSIIHKVQTFLKLHKINYVVSFATSDGLKALQYTKENIDELCRNLYTVEGFNNFKNIIDDIDFNKIFNICIDDLTVFNKFPRGPGFHPLEEAHFNYAKEYKRFIDDKIIPSINHVH